MDVPIVQNTPVHHHKEEKLVSKQKQIDARDQSFNSSVSYNYQGEPLDKEPTDPQSSVPSVLAIPDRYSRK